MDLEKTVAVLKAAIKRLYGFYVIRPLQRFNIQNRTEKVLKQAEQLPKVAPRHPGIEERIQSVLKEHPEIKSQLETRPSELLERLKQVKVSSTDNTDQDEMQRLGRSEEEKKKLPKQRRSPDETSSHGYFEPKTVPIGRTSLTSAVKFINDHTKDENLYDYRMIAGEYKMKEEDVDNILKYFKLFYLKMPTQQYDTSIPFFSRNQFAYMDKAKLNIHNVPMAIFGEEQYKKMLKEQGRKVELEELEEAEAEEEEEKGKEDSATGKEEESGKSR